ncbi:Protein-lysine N-methyltransferase efm4 [Mitosporidium daphniae]|uniref:Uncharacterized protein n=1 Tax=Mitosporidium daphniae TaxID=1485682 RepID=A0A098VME7_9MICR|nr:uncharacterized protein DI09_7p120 [Mitosporidium daphniae]KGG50233.1 hypothetical protein DI09_7p120 [Mitosporidium daphniae]|eukprot:XP_013236660.1 uncharacterized protein DI09_7p120 [Mitosporidium daphniae]
MDYVDEAIELASKNAAALLGGSFSWKVADFLTFSCDSTYSLIFDKGTFDAITLGACAQRPLDDLVHQYRASLRQLALPATTIFIIVSCNWTIEELDRWFGAGMLYCSHG